jgi:molecular chaperone IbpA
MTKLQPVNFNDKFLDQYFVGHDRFFKNINEIFDDISSSKISTSYPPYNIRKTSDSTFAIDVAVAGFSEKDLDITLQENTLTIVGTHAEQATNDVYLHHGIAGRGFKRSYIVQDLKITEVTLENGMLSINLEHVLPEEKKPKKIEILKKKQLLQE